MATATKKKTKLVPLKDHVIVRRTEAGDMTSGGIILPEAAKEKPKEGIVIAVGSGQYNDRGVRVPMQVEEGDRVIFSSYAGNEVKIDGEEWLILTEDDILAVIK